MIEHFETVLKNQKKSNFSSKYNFILSLLFITLKLYNPVFSKVSAKL